MKKQFVLILMTVMGVISCQKEEISSPEINSSSQINQDVKVQVANNMLSFKTREDYDKTIDYLVELGDEKFASWEEGLLFNSMRKAYSEEELEEKGITDNLLATLLNPDGMIQIGENVLKVDIANEQVSVIPANKYAGKSTLASENSRIFSTEDDVLEILEGKVETDEGQVAVKRKKKFCNGERISDDRWSTYGGVIKIEYQRSGILFVLHAKITRGDFTGTIPVIGYKTVGTNDWESRRGSGTFSDEREGFDRVYHYRPYHSTRRLKNFHFSVRFHTYAYFNGPPHYYSTAKTLTISCHK